MEAERLMDVCQPVVVGKVALAVALEQTEKVVAMWVAVGTLVAAVALLPHSSLVAAVP